MSVSLGNTFGFEPGSPTISANGTTNAILWLMNRNTNELTAYDPNNLADQFTSQQIIELCLTVGLSNLINRFHATFLTELDPHTQTALADSCPLPYRQPDEPKSQY